MICFKVSSGCRYHRCSGDVGASARAAAVHGRCKWLTIASQSWSKWMGGAADEGDGWGNERRCVRR